MTYGADTEVLVIGSGPAAVSVAWPLVEAGIAVLMIDASDGALPPPPIFPSLEEWRRSEDRWQIELGDRGRFGDGGASPKLGTPLSRAVLDGFAERAGVETSNFSAFGSLAAGGLSQIWGALAVRYSASDLSGFPGERHELTDSYRRVSDRIGVHHIPESALTPAVSQLMTRHRKLIEEPGFTLSLASNAVLRDNRRDRLGCNLCGLCLHGCGRGSIYQSKFDVADLRRFQNFTYRQATWAEAILEELGTHVVQARSADGIVRLRARTVVLAAGTLMTTSLALRRIGHVGRPIRLQTNPVGGAAFVVPSLVGQTLPNGSFGLGQLFYTLRVKPDFEAAGVVYGADSLPLGPIADRLPFTRSTALRLARALAPALILTSGYLPGRFSENQLIVHEDGASGRVSIEGRQTAEAERMLRALFRSFGRLAARRGAWPIPHSAEILRPGGDAHLTSTLPMGGEGAAATTSDGEMNGVAGLYVADGAALPLLSARHPTLTIMANADRIGRTLARRLSVPMVVARAS